MNLAFTEEQEMLKTLARDFLTDKLPKATVKEIEAGDTGYSPEMWKEIAELGWMGLALPEEYGGVGAGEGPLQPQPPEVRLPDELFAR